MEAVGWRVEVRGWRLEGRGWRLVGGQWRVEVKGIRRLPGGDRL